MLALYLSVLDDRNFEEDFTEVYNTYKRLVYHTAYKIMDDSYLAEDVLQEVFLYVAKNFSKIHRENCHELAAYLVSYSRSSCSNSSTTSTCMVSSSFNTKPGKSYRLEYSATFSYSDGRSETITGSTSR